MYKRTILNTMRFKAVMAINLLKLRSLAYFYESSTRMGDLLESLVWESQKPTYCVIGSESLHKKSWELSPWKMVFKCKFYLKFVSNSLKLWAWFLVEWLSRSFLL